jgi:hypothetical protein
MFFISLPPALVQSNTSSFRLLASPHPRSDFGSPFYILYHLWPSEVCSAFLVLLAANSSMSALGSSYWQKIPATWWPDCYIFWVGDQCGHAWQLLRPPVRYTPSTLYSYFPSVPFPVDLLLTASTWTTSSLSLFCSLAINRHPLVHDLYIYYFWSPRWFSAWFYGMCLQCCSSSCRY